MKPGLTVPVVCPWLRDSGKARLSLAAVEPKSLPLTAVEMERHVFSSQAFIPYDSKGFLVLVNGLKDGPNTLAVTAKGRPKTPIRLFGHENRNRGE